MDFEKSLDVPAADQMEGNEGSAREELSAEHREYLLKRHGTTDLIPLPSMDPSEPLNWSPWKKNINLVLLAFHAMMTTFIASGIIPAFSLLSASLNVSLTCASYLTSIQILILGLAPLFWRRIANHYGRRPIWLLSTLGSCICNIGCANCHNYGTLAVCRILVAFFISPAIAISSGVVVDLFFAKERGQKMGFWILMVTLGPPCGPFIMGFVAYHTNGYKWIFYIYAITNAVQFILYFLLSPETLYKRSDSSQPAKRHNLSINFRPVSDSPLLLSEFLAPLSLFAYPTVLIPTVAYSILFGFASVLLTVEIPELFIQKFEFNPQQLGLQFLGMIIGSVLGEQLSGYGSDIWMRLGGRRKQGVVRVDPEWRIWLAYIGVVAGIIGLVVFCVQVDNVVDGRWNVTPIVGIAISSFGSQVVGTVVTTYTVDRHSTQAASVGVFINAVRSTWGFIGPFWFPDMFTALGLRGSAGLMGGVLVVFGTGGLVFVQVFGRRLR